MTVTTVRCPGCDKLIVGAASTDVTPNAPQRGPRIGDLAICVECGTVSILAPGEQLIALTEAQINKLSADNLETVRAERQRIRGTRQ